jgi:methionyl aminopeptidase
MFFYSAGEDKNQNSGIVNLYPNYNYSGKLRPWPQTPKRSVPDSIRRPDYANHAEGRSLSEEKMRGNQEH